MRPPVPEVSTHQGALPRRLNGVSFPRLTALSFEDLREPQLESPFVDCILNALARLTSVSRLSFRRVSLPDLWLFSVFNKRSLASLELVDVVFGRSFRYTLGQAPRTARFVVDRGSVGEAVAMWLVRHSPPGIVEEVVLAPRTEHVPFILYQFGPGVRRLRIPLRGLTSECLFSGC